MDAGAGGAASRPRPTLAVLAEGWSHEDVMRGPQAAASPRTPGKRHFLALSHNNDALPLQSAAEAAAHAAAQATPAAAAASATTTAVPLCPAPPAARYDVMAAGARKKAASPSKQRLQLARGGGDRAELESAFRASLMGGERALRGRAPADGVVMPPWTRRQTRWYLAHAVDRDKPYHERRDGESPEVGAGLAGPSPSASPLPSPQSSVGTASTRRRFQDEDMGLDQVDGGVDGLLLHDMAGLEPPPVLARSVSGHTKKHFAHRVAARAQENDGRKQQRRMTAPPKDNGVATTLTWESDSVSSEAAAAAARQRAARIVAAERRERLAKRRAVLG